MMKYMLMLLLILSGSCNAKILLLSIEPDDEFRLFSKKSNNLESDTNNLLLNQFGRDFFDFKIVTPSELNQLLASDQAVCAVSRLKTPSRQQTFLFTIPIHLYPSHRLYYFKQSTPIDASLINSTGKLKSLNSLMVFYPDKTIIREIGKSYGTAIDAALSELAPHNVSVQPYKTSADTIIKEFSSGKVDFILAYPTVFQNSFPKDKAHLIGSLPLANNLSHLEGHIACSHTRETQAFIKQANAMIRALYPTKLYITTHLKYLPKPDHLLITRRLAMLSTKYKPIQP
ncbi:MULTISPECIES: type 2 periplasmic-binding domain-containing protein [Pseudoalteromonas]|nr:MULTISPECIES: transporter substrate-binding domain-containing protein [Pseudoalteromonas]